MNASGILRVVLTVAGAAALAGAWTWSRIRRRRRKSPEEIERLRRLELNRRGRITTGHIVDLPYSGPADFSSRVVVYRYEVAGVSYEAAQDLTGLPVLASVILESAGQTVSVKYDPRKPTNSILACENWCGISAAEVIAKPKTQPIQNASEASEGS